MDIEDEMKCYLTGVPDGKYIKKKKKRKRQYWKVQ